MVQVKEWMGGEKVRMKVNTNFKSAGITIKREVTGSWILGYEKILFSKMGELIDVIIIEKWANREGEGHQC